jgi:RHS repeat-associated protein
MIIRDVTEHDVSIEGNAVGSIKGNTSVSHAGKLSHYIPISLVQGTNGMTPSIGLQYGGVEINGFVGKGWNIAGLSSISRVGKSRFIDGMNEEIQFSQDGGLLALDGQRLIKTGTDAANNAVYGQRNGNTIRVSHEYGAGYDRYIVETKSGTTIEYGGSCNSRLTNSNYNFVWMKTKETDMFGNYIEYKYNQQNGEIWLTEILYTGNSETNDLPYYSVNFNYESRSDKNTTYMNGESYQMTLLLKDIQVSYYPDPTNTNVSELVKKYVLEYELNEYSYLRELTEYGADGTTHFNPTVFEYDYNTNSELEISAKELDPHDIATTIAPEPFSNYGKETYYSADFNNDGILDRMVVEHNHDNTNTAKWFLQFGRYYECDGSQDCGDLEFYNSPGHEFQFSTVDDTQDHRLLRSNVIIQDINNDGYNDIIIPWLDVKDNDWDGAEKITAGENQYDKYNITVRMNNAGTFRFADRKDYIINDDRLVGVTDYAILNEMLIPGDYDGDGYIELLLKSELWNYLNGSKSDWTNCFGNLDLINLTDNNGQLFTNPEAHKINFNTTSGRLLTEHSYELMQVIPSDFNKDGKTDFLLIEDESTNDKIYEINYDAQLGYHKNEIYQLSEQLHLEHEKNGTPRLLYNYYLGDFNGDGNIDLFYENREPSSPGDWSYEIKFWEGDDFSSAVPFSDLEPLNWESHQSNTRYLFVNDFNGDGKSDIFSYILWSSSYDDPPTFPSVHTLKYRLFSFNGFHNGNLRYTTFNHEKPYSNALYYSSPWYLKHSLWRNGGDRTNPYPINLVKHNDYNNDSTSDIYNFNENGSILSIFSGSGQGELTGIYDGYNNKKEIFYEPVAKLNSVNINVNSAYRDQDLQSNLPNNYSFIHGSYKLVSATKDYSNGDHYLPFKGTHYHYEDGIVHRWGRGFIGFKNFEENVIFSNSQNDKIIYHYEIDNGLSELELDALVTYKHNTLLSTTFYDYIKNTNIGYNRYLKNINTIIKIDQFNGVNQHITTLYDDYQNLTKHVQRIGSGLYPINKVRTKDIAYLDPPVGTWCKAFPETTSISTEHIDDLVNAPYYRETKNYYNPDGSLEYTENDPDKGNDKETKTYEYDSYGNVTKTTKSNIGLDDVVKEDEYSPDGRFLLKEYGNLNDRVNPDIFTENTYIQKFGLVDMSYDIYRNSIDYNYDIFGRLESETDQNDNSKIVSYAWDYNSIDINGFTRQTIYRNNVETKNALQGPTEDGNLSSSFYNSRGQIIRSRIEVYSEDYVNNRKFIIADKDYYTNGLLLYESYPYYESSSPAKQKTYTYDPITLKPSSVIDNGRITTYDYSQPRITSVTDHAGRTSSKETNFAGDLLISTDPAGNTVNFEYHNNGQIRKTTTVALNQSNALEVEITYDDLGRKSVLIDPDAGNIGYQYNAYGELTEQSNTNGTTKYYYDVYGRKDRVENWDIGSNTADKTTQYQYYSNTSPQKGLLHKILGPNMGQEQEHFYDPDGRTLAVMEKIDSETFQTSYLYDNTTGWLQSETYTTGVQLTYDYDQKGHMKEKIRTDVTPNLSIWKLEKLDDERGVVTEYTRGVNDRIKNISIYDDFGLRNAECRVNGVTALNYDYDYDPMTRNMVSRRENVKSIEERFTYIDPNDPNNHNYKLDRLTTSEIFDINNTSLYLDNLSYNFDGGINTKTSMGTYSYSTTGMPTDNKPHAVKSVSTNSPEHLPTIYEYTHFNSIEKITRCEREALLLYGPDEQRRKLSYSESGVPIYDKYYFGNFEKKIDYETGQIIEITYIDGAAIVNSILGEQTYFINTDHLGSITQLMDTNGNVMYEFSYDAWGKLRSASDWSEYAVNNTSVGFEILSRGFTGHEHLVEFGIINMNGRIYDPSLGQFMQPDNYVQFPEYASSYNRYSYVLNNPMSYTDPDGELIWIPVAIGTLWGGYNGYFGAKHSGASGLGLFQSTLMGSALGAASGYIGGTTSIGLGESLSSVTGAGTYASAIGSGIGSLVNSGGWAVMNGADGWDVTKFMLNSLASGSVGGGVSAYVGGSSGAFAGGYLSRAVNGILQGESIDLSLHKNSILTGGMSVLGDELQRGAAYLNYQSSGGNFSYSQFRQISIASQRSFSQGREYGGWILGNGSVKMWPPGEQAGISPTTMPKNATGFFHTHPNMGLSSSGSTWVEQHSPADIAANNTHFKTLSYVIGRNNVWIQQYNQSPSILYNSSANMFNVYPHRFLDLNLRAYW